MSKSLKINRNENKINNKKNDKRHKSITKTKMKSEKIQIKANSYY